MASAAPASAMQRPHLQRSNAHEKEKAVRRLHYSRPCTGSLRLRTTGSLRRQLRAWLRVLPVALRSILLRAGQAPMIPLVAMPVLSAAVQLQVCGDSEPAAPAGGPPQRLLARPTGWSSRRNAFRRDHPSRLHSRQEWTTFRHRLQPSLRHLFLTMLAVRTGNSGRRLRKATLTTVVAVAATKGTTRPGTRM